MVSNLTLKKLKLYVTCQHLRTNMHCSSSLAWQITYQNSFPSTVTSLVLWDSWFIRMWSGAGMRLMRRLLKDWNKLWQRSSLQTPLNMALVQYAYSEDGLYHLHHEPSHTESRYAQIEKEMLALVFATKKCHDFIYGRPVTVETDHQPLITILSKPLHTASPRLQGMMMKLHRYHLDVIFKHGKELFVADALSRAHLSTSDPQLTDDLLEVMTFQVLSSGRIDEIRAAVQKDVTCQQLADMIRNGWPATSKELPYSLRPFFSMRDELTTQDYLLLRGERFIIPPVLQTFYVGQLHQGLPGIAATKRRAKETMYWPSMYTDIDTEISCCAPCNALKPHQAKEPLQLHEIPDIPWSFTAADLFDLHGKHIQSLWIPSLGGSSWTTFLTWEATQSLWKYIFQYMVFLIL